MEELGWLQGSLVKREDLPQLLSLIGDEKLIAESSDITLIVASGSCDVANPKDPVIEFSIARYTDSVNGNFSSNKNPRELHCNLEASMTTSFSIALQAHEKFSILKDKIVHGISPDSAIKFSQNELLYYVEWLAGRYKRPAFPTEFDKRIDSVWKKDKRKRDALKVSEKLLGIYAKVFPDSEIQDNETYSVDLLALVVPGLDSNGDDFNKIKDFVGKYQKALQEAKMDVGELKILSEFQISVGTFKQYKRFNLDELSYKLNHPFPPELEMN